MIETLLTPPLPSDVAVSTAALAGFADLQDRIAGRPCSECAYPKCYETSAFYTPRPDLHCPRFEAGIEPVAVDGNLGPHRIRFRHWGNLEGSGAPTVRPMATAHARFAIDARISGAIAAIPARYAVKRKLAAQWNTERTPHAPCSPNSDSRLTATPPSKTGGATCRSRSRTAMWYRFPTSPCEAR